jgi:AcrR family transcriptional regulator
MTKQLVRPTARGSKRKAELLAASASLFEQFGYHNVSMDDIAASVGITGPALYRHFPNKHDVLVQAISAQVASVELVAMQVLADRTDGEARFEQLLDAMVTLVLDIHPVLLWKRERPHLNANEQHAVRLRVRRFHQQTIQIIRGWRHDVSDRDAQLFSWILQSIVSNTSEYRNGLDRPPLVQELTQMARAALSVELSSAVRDQPRIRAGHSFVPAGRRERVLDAAAQLFYEHGYRAVSVEEIAEGSQTAIATVYQLVASKADLLHAILARGSEGTTFLTAHRLGFAADDESPLDVILDTFIELACGPHARLFKILASDSVYLEDDARRALRRSQREYLEEWVVALGQHRPELTAGQVRARVHTAVAVIAETVLIPAMRRRPSLHGELRLIASAIFDA